MTPQSTNVSANQNEVTLEKLGALLETPVPYLLKRDISVISYGSQPAIRLPYCVAGKEQSKRYITALGNDCPMVWQKDCRPTAFGLNTVQNAEQIVLVDKETDQIRLDSIGVASIAIPADCDGSWHTLLPQQIKKILCAHGSKIYKDLIKSSFKQRIYAVAEAQLVEVLGRQTNDLKTAVDQLWLKAKSYPELVKRSQEINAKKAWDQCQALAQQENILEALSQKLEYEGTVGCKRAPLLVYLALTSRLLMKPVSLILKGQSGAGKSHAVQEMLKLFPSHAYHQITAQSEKSLVISDQSYVHRHLVWLEAAGLNKGLGQYFLRTLLSEGCIDYTTTKATKNGREEVCYHKDGPTGIVLTTTADTLHHEDETRMLSVPVVSSPEQQKAIHLAIARELDGSLAALPEKKDNTEWQALQTWLTLAGKRKVIIPYASLLMSQINPETTRSARDPRSLASLIQAHALLHRATRETDSKGSVIATIADYRAVYELTHDLFDNMAEDSVKPHIREVVECVQNHGLQEASYTDIAVILKKHRSTIKRACEEAIADGWLLNSNGRGQEAKLRLGRSLPASLPSLPDPETLCCTVAPQKE